MEEKKLTGYPSIDMPQNKGASFFEKRPIIPNVSIYNSIKLITAFYKDKSAINCIDLTANYNQLISDSVTISRALKEFGVKKGDIVSVSMPNYYQAVASFLACNRIGAVTTFLNPSASNEEICEYLNLFESPVLINYDKSNEENIKVKDKTKVNYIVTLHKDQINSLALDKDYHITSNDSIIDFNSLESISKYQKTGIPTNSSKNNSLILFTSGTTGKPKSVVLTNENVLAAGIYLKNSSHVKTSNGDKTLVCVPFSYPYGFVTSTIMTLLSGKTAILAPNMSKDTISYYLKKNPNIIFGSPALLDLIMKNVSEDQDLSSITTFISGGDFLTPSHSTRGKEFFKARGAENVEIGNGSGNAETVSCGTNPMGVESRPETVGKILVGTDAMVIDPDTMEEKKYNEEGMLCVSGKHVFKEYYKEPELTSQAKFQKNGKTYFKTGTLGFIDKDGYFTLTGRQSRFYIISTLNKVYCDHVQTIISYFDNVSECAIVKVPDEEMLYVNKVYIVLKNNNESNDTALEDIKRKFNEPVETLSGQTEQLKWYEIPTYIEFVSELPRKKGTEKIDYMLLEQDAVNKLNEKQKVLKK